MRIKNTTALNTYWLRQMVTAVKPTGVANFDVAFTSTKRRSRGIAYPKGHGYHARSVPFVNIRLDPDCKYPDVWQPRKGYLGMLLLNVCETALFITAHELRHLWQGKVKSGYRVWGARGQYSERDADAYAISMVRKYRRGELACPTGIVPSEPTLEAKFRQKIEMRKERKLKHETHVREQVMKWERKAKLAKTMVRKWVAKLKRIEKSSAKT